MKLFPYLFLFLVQSIAFCQNQYVVQIPASNDNQQSVRVISDVPKLPSEVVSIEREASMTQVTFKNGEKIKFDLSIETELRKFMKLFSDETHTPSHDDMDTPNQFLRAPTSGSGIHVITFQNDELVIDVIPEEIVKDKKQLMNILKRYDGLSVQ
jgi:hypothetical protein